MSLDGIKANVAQFQVGNTKDVKKQETKNSTGTSGGHSHVAEKGDELLQFAGLQAMQQFQAKQADSQKQLFFDPSALTAQLESGAISQDTQDGLAVIGKNMPMFSGVTQGLENISGDPAFVLEGQNAFIKEFS